MVTFAGIFARTAFAQLPQATATSFMRAAFSSYYVVMAVFAAVAAASLAWFRPPDALVLGFVAIGFLVSRQWLMPLAHRAQVAREAGASGAAERFGTIHGRSVRLNFVKTIAAALLLDPPLMSGTT